MTIGTSPAQAVTSASSGGISGGPVRTLAEASSIAIVRIAVALSSCGLGERTSDQRPGSSFSVNASSATSLSAGSSSAVSVPRTIADS